MGLPWVRLDSGFSQNPKVLHLIEDKKWQAVVVYVSSLGYSGHHGTDGFIPQAALPFIHGTKTHANQLVNIGLWVPNRGGFDINGWSEFQPSDEETKARKARAKAAAELRWARIREASQS